MRRKKDEGDSKLKLEVAEVQRERERKRHVWTALETEKRRIKSNPGPRNIKRQSPEHTAKLQCLWHDRGVGVREPFDYF